MNRREKIAAASKSYNEKNDCAVRAVAVATGLDYEVVHAEFEKRGRKRRHGIYIHVTMEVLKALGFQCKEIKVKARTIRTLQQSRELPLWGSFIVRTTKHLTGVVDRAFLDWAVTTVKRVQAVWLVTPLATDCSDESTSDSD